jgi:hypothetical protein
MNETDSVKSDSRTALPRGGGTLAGIATAIAGGGLLLRYLHMEGIEPAFLDIVTTPTVSLSILLLFMGLLSLLAFMFIVPIWRIGRMLTEKMSARTGALRRIFPGFFAKWSKETLCALGLLAWCRRRAPSSEAPPEQTATATNTPTESGPWKRHGVSLLIIGTGWALPFVISQVFALGAEGSLGLLLLTTFLAALGLARWQGRSLGWGLQMFIFLLLGGVNILMFSRLIQKTVDGVSAVLSAGSFILTYLGVLVLYLGLHSALDKAKAGESRDGAPIDRVYRATPAWAWQWLPVLVPILYLALGLLFLTESHLLGRAAVLAGIKGNDRQVWVKLFPATGQLATEKAPGRETAPSDGGQWEWRKFETIYHFGAIGILCCPLDAGQAKDQHADQPTNQNAQQAKDENCYVAHNGVIRYAFPKTTNTQKNPQHAP